MCLTQTDLGTSKLILEDRMTHAYCFLFLNLPSFFLFFFPPKTWKVDFVGKNNKKKTNKETKTPPKPPPNPQILYLIIAVGLLFGQHFCDPTCNMIFTDDRWCLYMHIKHFAKCMIFQCKVGYADRNRALKVRCLERLELSF